MMRKQNVCALAVKPKVLILDEPTNGLDPMMQKRLFTELKSQSANGVAVLLSSHNIAIGLRLLSKVKSLQ